MGGKHPVPARNPVPPGKIRLCEAGFVFSHHTARARKLIDTIVKLHPDKYESWYYFAWGGEYRAYIAELKKTLPDDKLAEHTSSPFCWLEYPDGRLEGKGGRDRMCEWAQEAFPNPEIQELATTEPSFLREAYFDNKTPGTADISPPGNKAKAAVEEKAPERA
mmetsp:Transcript_524/g.587  ORF Transcript_524/g.587 Transcript_524/m.587 type:complete len:163 (+) Transcript_524:32-520(+)